MSINKMRRKLGIRRLFFMAWLGLAFLICIGSLIPITTIPLASGLFSDKLMHGTAYSVLGGFALLSGATVRRQVGLIFVTFLIGLVIEIIQPLTGRFFEVNDIVANSLGLFLAISLYFGGAFFTRRFHQSKEIG